MSIEKLENLKQVDIRTVSADTLINIEDVQIDPSLPKSERMGSFMKQIKNPFCYKCNGIIVKSVYDDSGDNLEAKLVGLFMTMSGIV